MARIPMNRVCRTELLLDDLEDLLLVEFLGEALNGGQGLTTIALWWACVSIALMTPTLVDGREGGYRG